RFGSNWDGVEEQKQKRLAQIDQWTSFKEKREALQSILDQLKAKNLSLAQFLSQKRQKAAPVFSLAIETELKDLNLSSAQFKVLLKERAIASHGFDEIQFLFSANPGTIPLSLEECASGGELSRLNLAIQ